MEGRKEKGKRGRLRREENRVKERKYMKFPNTGWAHPATYHLWLPSTHTLTRVGAKLSARTFT